MNFAPTESQVLIRETARDFASRRIAPGAAERDRTGAFPFELLREMAGLGLMGVNVPEAYGGTQAGAVAYALALHEVAKADASVAVTMAVNNMVAEAIVRFGTEDQRRAHVPHICSGAYPGAAFALSEPNSGSDAAALRTTAERRGDGFVLTGQKVFVTTGSHAGVIVVYARSNPAPGPKGVSAFLVPRDARGISVLRVEEKMGQHASNTVLLALDGVEVPESALLGEEGQGFVIAMSALDGGRIGVGAMASGIGMAALDAAAAYAKERTQFGRPIGDTQAIQWMLADMKTELEAALLLALQAAYLKEQGVRFTRVASMAKLFASEAANRACLKAVQVLGGYGYTREFPVERYLRDVRVTTIYEGTSEVQKIVIARELLGS
jgi:alkylation response protein AidB-like acyl-CoA dehydrogenase